MTNDNYKLANYATFEKNSKGRLYNENDSKYRSIYGRDRDRIINSTSFRRLQYKTQVFVNHTGDHYRTRLTHCLEVAQIARWIASGLHVNKNLSEVVALSHDLGHTAFGHAGEDALNEKMADFGGFSHNAHVLKILTKLEKSYINFNGLNLSWEMLEGVIKHNGPINLKERHEYIIEYNKIHDLDLNNFSSIEAQIAAIADDIAYNNHDIEDGLRSKLIHLDQIIELPFMGEIIIKILDQYPNISQKLLISETKRRIINIMVQDVINTTKENIKKLNIQTSQEVRICNKQIVHFSDKLEQNHQILKKFLNQNLYKHPQVNRMTAIARKIIHFLYDFYTQNSNCLPKKYQKEIKNFNSKKQLAILVSDHIAGMTDRFAQLEYNQLN